MRRPWADVNVESQEELDAPYCGSDYAGSWSSGLGPPNDRDGSAHSETGSASTPNGTKKKLHNKRLTREQLLLLAATDSMGSDSASELHSSGPGDVQACFSHDSTTETPDRAPIHGDRGMEAAVESAGFEGEVSQGSVGHELGTCKPCLFVHSKVGCQNGAECTFCHMQHTRNSKPRPCKGKRDRYKKLIARSIESQSNSSQVGSADYSRDAHSQEADFSSDSGAPAFLERYYNDDDTPCQPRTSQPWSDGTTCSPYSVVSERAPQAVAPDHRTAWDGSRAAFPRNQHLCYL